MFHVRRLVLSLLIPLIAGWSCTGHADMALDAKTLASKAYADTKVSTTQLTGYQVLTTGASGTVTPEYLTVPVTTITSGRPTTSNTPIAAAAMWIE